MKIILENLATDLINRLDGPLHFRFFLQPIIVTFFAFRDGSLDVLQNRAPYVWTILTNPKHRRFLLKHGWKRIYKVFIFALLLDFIYQFLVLRDLNLQNALIVASLLSIIPYGLLRGAFNRLIRLLLSK